MLALNVTGSKGVGAVLQEVSIEDSSLVRNVSCVLAFLFAPSSGVTSGVGQPFGTVASHVLAFLVCTKCWCHKWCHKLGGVTSLVSRVVSQVGVTCCLKKATVQSP